MVDKRQIADVKYVYFLGDTNTRLNLRLNAFVSISFYRKEEFQLTLRKSGFLNYLILFELILIKNMLYLVCRFGTHLRGSSL